MVIFVLDKDARRCQRVAIRGRWGDILRKNIGVAILDHGALALRHFLRVMLIRAEGTVFVPIESRLGVA